MNNKSIVKEASAFNEGLQIVVPTKISRPVRFKDLWKVLKDSTRIKFAMLSPFPGRYPEAMSMSHCQIEPNDPLRFFVVSRGHRQWKHLRWFFGEWYLGGARTIMNPEIVWHGK